MKTLATALALTALAASPALARDTFHFSPLLPPLVTPTYQGHHLLAPAGTTWHDNARWGEPPRPTGTWARSQDWKHYVPVDTYDVVDNGTIVGRDPDPNIRIQLLHEAERPAP
jgi:hypothetical protein